MNLDYITPYQIIEELKKKILELEQENEKLKEKVNENDSLAERNI